MPDQKRLAPMENHRSGVGAVTVGHFRTPFLHFSETFIYGLLDNFSRRVRSIVFTRDAVNQGLFPYPRVVDYSFPRFSAAWAVDNVARRIFGRHDVRLASEVKSRGVQVMHAHFGEEGYWLLNVKKALNLPLVTTFYGYDLSELLMQDIWRRRYKELFQTGDLFLVEGGHMKRTLVQAGCPEEKVRIQRIAINLEKIPFRERETADGKTVFLFCGRFIEKKGLIHALRACDRLVRKGAINFELRVIGDGPLREELESFVKSHGLEKYVVFLGRQPHSEFYRLLGEAHVYLAPSVTAANGDTEGGAPTTLLEAQASGMPVIASRHADIPEVMVDGKSGLLSDEADDAGLAENMHFMMTHPEAWPAFGRAGLDHMRAQHDIKRAILRLEDIYVELARGYGLETSGSIPPFVVAPMFFDEAVEPHAGTPAMEAPNRPVSAAFSGPMVCPACRTTLSVENERDFKCVSCGRAVGRIEEGTFVFGEPGKILGQDSLLKRLAHRLRFFKQQQVSGTLYKELANTELDNAYSLLSSFYKGGWRFFSDLSSDKTILSIESGVGSASFAAAPFVDRVFILHPCADVAKAITHQAFHQGYTNVQSISVNKADHLPFPDGFFDTVAIHGMARIMRESVRENLWADGGSFLKEVRRVVKPEGSIYLERRVSQPSRGFNPLNAVALASVRCALSDLGFRWKIFLGFSDQGPYLYKITDFSRVKAPLDKLKRFARMFLGVGRVGVMASGSEAGAKTAWLNRLANEILASPDDSLNLHFGSAGVYRVHNRKCVVRIPADGFAYARCVTNMNALKKLARLQLSFSTPCFLAHDELNGQPFFVESRLQAVDVPYMKLDSAQRGNYAAQAAAILAELHQKTREQLILDEDLFKRLFTEPLAKVRSYVDRETASRIEKTETFLRQEALNKPVSLVMVHGDFKVTNLLQDANRRLKGLFDWDMSSPLGLPGVDLIIYKGFDRCLETNRSYTRSIFEAGYEAANDPDIRSYRAALGLDDFWWNVQSLMALTHYFLHHSGEEKRHSAAWCLENISPFLRKACGRFIGDEAVAPERGIREQ